MLNQSRLLTSLSCIALLCLTACGEERVTAKRLRPAKIFIDTHRHVAVGQFDGDMGPEVTALLRDGLAASGRHQVADAAQSDSAQSHTAVEDFSPRWTSEFATALGVTAVILGRVAEEQMVNHHALNRGRTWNDDSPPNSWLHPWVADRVRTSQLKMCVTLLVVDHRGNVLSVVDSDVASSTAESRTSAFGSSEPTDWTPYRREITSDLSRQLMALFRPSVESHTFTFYKSASLPDSQRAIDALHRGAWDEAVTLYETGVARMQQQHTSVKYLSRGRYNLGLAQILAGAFGEGLANLELAQLWMPSAQLDEIIAYCRVYEADLTLARLQIAALGAPIEQQIIADRIHDEAHPDRALAETVLRAPWASETTQEGDDA